MTKFELIKELAKMEACEPTQKISQPTDVVAIFSEYADKDVEYFLVVTLDGKHSVINCHVISKGILDKTIVHPREVFFEAIKDRASAIIIGHNHPSGSLTPSREDNLLTKRLVDAGELMGIKVLDHVIVSKEGYYSFLEKEEI